MIVKICGLKTLEHSLIACEAGAKMLGFNFYQKSVRYIEEELCRQLVEEIKQQYPMVICVGIFVNHSPQEVQRILGFCKLDMAQLAGDEVVADYQTLPNKIFKAYRSKTFSELMDAMIHSEERSFSPDLLLDAFQKDAYGGSGKVGDWGLASVMAEKYDLLLAGGLDPDNVAQAIQQVNPWGVDVASGVEVVRGEKDGILIQKFIQQAMQASVLDQRI